MIHTLLQPVFQPIVDRAGNPFAYEALLRVKNNPLSPISMVRRWEKSGFITRVDIAMVKRVAEILENTGLKPRIAVNVSVETIETAGDEYLAALRQLIPLTQKVIVELTETVTIKRPTALLRFHAHCSAAGFLIALDDCRPGHPYGSSAFLNTFRPHLIKLDGPHLEQCFAGHELAWVADLIKTAHSIHAAVIAEYVSSAALKAFAFRIGADFAQGFAVGIPAPTPGTPLLLPEPPPWDASRYIGPLYNYESAEHITD